ncbi:hypothetical protein F5B19DRAFT_99548 [Rostrohypoxylon terebratum]|nr:hypothetical protein F5B19DRAFT_99548 [Rostrohypoxylon terebratum]
MYLFLFLLFLSRSISFPLGWVSRVGWMYYVSVRSHSLACRTMRACETGLVQYAIRKYTYVLIVIGKYRTGNSGATGLGYPDSWRLIAKPRGSLLDMTLEEGRVVGG